MRSVPMKTSVGRLSVAAVCLTAGLALSGCGSAASSSSGSGQGGAQAQSGRSGRSGQAGGFMGMGGSGKVAAVAGRTAQVQGAKSQVAVTWTAKTLFSQQVAAKASDLKVGDCVVAMPDFQNGASSSSSASSGVAASTVRISTAVKGSCTRPGFGGGPGDGRPGGGPSWAPSGAPSGAPRGMSGGRGFGAFGKVTAVSGSGFTVESMQMGSSSTSSVSVTTTSNTTWTRQAVATAQDVKVGRCVVSRGQADATGAITATSIMISEPTNGQCSSGFHGRPGGRPGQGLGGQGAAGTSS